MPIKNKYAVYYCKRICEYIIIKLIKFEDFSTDDRYFFIYLEAKIFTLEYMINVTFIFQQETKSSFYLFWSWQHI